MSRVAEAVALLRRAGLGRFGGSRTAALDGRGYCCSIRCRRTAYSFLVLGEGAAALGLRRRREALLEGALSITDHVQVHKRPARHVQVHDELDISVMNDLEAAKIKDVMESAVDLEVPNKVDYESGPNWVK